jgi:hypothetical protein
MLGAGWTTAARASVMIPRREHRCLGCNNIAKAARGNRACGGRAGAAAQPAPARSAAVTLASALTLGLGVKCHPRPVREAKKLG